jgi:hypothetical protein
MRCFFHLVNGREMILDDTGLDVIDLEWLRPKRETLLASCGTPMAGAVRTGADGALRSSAWTAAFFTPWILNRLCIDRALG